MIRQAFQRSSSILPRHSLGTNSIFPLSCRPRPSRPSRQQPPLARTFAAKSTADEKIEDLQELYATARDEFEIASEETEKKTVYAADDRAAAKEELEKLQVAFADAVNGVGGEEIQRRIGQRVRELESAVKAMEEMAMED